MNKKTFTSTLWLVSIVATFALSPQTQAETPVEIKLVATMEEGRGWCLDLRGGQNNAQPIGGVQGHTCYAYQGNGPSRDQGYVQEEILEQNRFRMASADFATLCMTIYEPKAGSFVSIETCDGRITQEIQLSESGQITPTMDTSLCLTLDSVILPGGGGTPLHVLRGATFEKCDATLADVQTWELRAEWNGLEEATAPRTYQNAAPRQRRN